MPTFPGKELAAATERFYKVSQRVHTSDEKHLEWFVKLLQLTLDNQHQAELNALWEDLGVISATCLSDLGNRKIMWDAFFELWMMRSKESRKEEMSALQKAVCQTINCWLDRGVTSVSIPSVVRYFGLHSAESRDSRPTPKCLPTNVSPTSYEGLPLYRFAHTFGRLHLLVRRCKAMNCQKPYVASRRDQTYCTPTCQSREGMRRFRKRAKRPKPAPSSQNLFTASKRGVKRRKKRPI